MSSSPPLSISLNFEEDVEFVTLTPIASPSKSTATTTTTSTPSIPITTSRVDEKFVTVHVSTTMLVDTTYVSVTPVASSAPAAPIVPTPTKSRPTLAFTSETKETAAPIPIRRNVVQPVSTCWASGKSYAQVLREAQDQRDAMASDSDMPNLSASTSPKVRMQHRLKAR